MQFALVGLRLLFSQHSFQGFCFLWSCSSRAGDWEGTVPSAGLTASGMPSQGSFVFHGCSGLGCLSMLEQRWLKGQRKEKERNEDPGKAEARCWRRKGYWLPKWIGAEPEGKPVCSEKHRGGRMWLIGEGELTWSPGEQEPAGEAELGWWEMQLAAQRGPGSVGRVAAAAAGAAGAG